MENNSIIIYGGSSFISKELLKIISNDFKQFIIFCRKKNIVQKYIEELRLENLNIKIFEIDLLDLNGNISIIEKLENDIVGVIWVSGFTGDPEEEYLNLEKCEILKRGKVGKKCK